MFADVVKQLPSRHILHDHEEICGCTYHLVPKTQTYICADMDSLYINIDPLSHPIPTFNHYYTNIISSLNSLNPFYLLQNMHSINTQKRIHWKARLSCDVAEWLTVGIIFLKVRYIKMQAQSHEWWLVGDSALHHNLIHSCQAGCSTTRLALGEK